VLPEKRDTPFAASRSFDFTKKRCRAWLATALHNTALDSIPICRPEFKEHRERWEERLGMHMAHPLNEILREYPTNALLA